MLFCRACVGVAEVHVLFLAFLAFGGVVSEEVSFLPVDHRSRRSQVWKAEGQILYNIRTDGVHLLTTVQMETEALGVTLYITPMLLPYTGISP